MFIGKLSMPRQAEWNTPRGGTQQRFFFFEAAPRLISPFDPMHDVNILLKRKKLLAREKFSAIVRASLCDSSASSSFSRYSVV
jgi:hypothetical protein